MVDLPVGLFAGDFTRDHPEATMRVYDSLPIGRRKLLARVVMLGVDSDTVESALRRHPKVKEVLRTGSDSGVDSFVVVLDEPSYLPLLQRFRILRLLPVVVHRGLAQYTVIASQRRLASFVKVLRHRVRSARVESVQAGLAARPAAPVLTRRQLDVFRVAVAEGYYEVPRRASLSDLARRLHRSKASLSELLARVESKLMRSELATQNHPSHTE